VITVRARWLACASAAGAGLGHLLDELGAIPGIHESAEVRAAVLDPARGLGIALVLVGAVAAGLLADRLLRRSRAAAVAGLALGQLVAAAGLESVARARLEAGPLEHGGLAAIGIQLAVALAVVAAASLTAQALRRVPVITSVCAPLVARAPTGRPVRVDSLRRVPCLGRAPPASA
jgi:hypothetical protein